MKQNKRTQTYVNESESEEETFDNDLHIEQLELIDTLNETVPLV